MPLTIDMLPARQGDALWIEYGDPTRRVLFDAGVHGTWEKLKPRLEALPEDDRHFELLVISHIDADHIAGSLPLLENSAELGVTFGDVWFNGYRHLIPDDAEPMGPVQGEKLTTLLLDGQHPWNEAFDRKAVVVPAEGDLPRRELEGGLALTLLSPGQPQLTSLEPEWAEAVREAGLDPQVEAPEEEEIPDDVEAFGAEPDVAALAAEQFTQDKAKPNGSSIAALVEFDGASAILAADAHPLVVEAAVKRMLDASGQQKVTVGAFKVPHHGSRSNINMALLDLVETPLYLFSSDGTQTQHPHPQAVARSLAAGGAGSTLAFNYLSEFNEPWRDPDTIERYGYDVEAPDEGAEGLRVSLD